MKRLLALLALLCGLAHSQTLTFPALSTNNTWTGTNTFTNSLIFDGTTLSNVHGNGSKVQLFTGSAVSQDCAKFDSGGNIVDAGAPCGATGPANTSTALTFGMITVPVTGLKVISNAMVVGLGSGDVDIYTVPGGKKALVVDCSVTNPTGSGTNMTLFAEFKVSGIYTKYDFMVNNVVPGTLGQLTLLAPMLLNAGESWAINSSAAGATVWPFILEFDATAAISVSRFTSFAAGDNTTFTAPANGIVPLANLEGVAAGSPMKGTIWYFNNTGISRTIGYNIVPQGGSVGNSNQFKSGLSVSSPAISVVNYYGGMKTGDFINLNTDANTAGQIAWVIYQSLP